MTTEQLIAKQEIRELVDEFSILADNRDAKGQGPLFTEDAVLEFQLGPEGDIHEIPGRDAIVAAFENTVGETSTAKAVYHAIPLDCIARCDFLSHRGRPAFGRVRGLLQTNGRDARTACARPPKGRDSGPGAHGCVMHKTSGASPSRTCPRWQRLRVGPAGLRRPGRRRTHGGV